MKRYGFLLTAGCALVLSACGGGGGSGSSDTGTTPPPPVQTSTLSPITAENSTSVAANAYAGTDTFSETASSVGGLLTGVSVTPAGTGTGAVAPVLAFVKRTYGAGAPRLLTGVTQSEACSGGGTVTLDANLRNQNTISNGDTVAVTVSNCREDGNVLNGALSLTVSGVSGDPLNSSTGAVTLDTVFKNFAITSGSEGATLDGDMKIVLNVTSDQSTLNVSGASLKAVEQQSGTTVTTLTMSAYSVNGTVKGSTMTNAASFTVSGSSNALGKFNYTVKNLQPFVSTGSGMPSSGSLIVNGASSSVTATAVNSSSVRVDYSAKGDGVITQTKTLSWAEFQSAY